MRAVYRQLKSLKAALRQQVLAAKLAQLGPGSAIDATVRLDYPDRINIGSGVRIGHCSVVRANSELSGAVISIDDDAFVQDFCLMNANEGFIRLGERSWLGAGSHIYGNGGVEIGKDVLIAAHTVINTVSHNFDDLTNPVNAQGINVDPVVIGDDVWIGTGVKILQGVTIGKGAIVGAGSLVNRDVPDYAIAYGTPARVASYRTETELKEKVA